MADSVDLEEQERRLARARSRSVFIASPIARHPVRQYTDSLSRTLLFLAQLGIRAYYQRVVGSSNLPRARNELAAAFLASDYTDTLLIDDDMGWEPNDVLRLLSSNREVIGAVGCKKVIRPDTDRSKWCARWLPGDFNVDEAGAIEVEGVGTGFMKISRSVFASLIAAHPEWKRRGWPSMPQIVRDQYYRFFAFDPDDPEEYGEDIAFCRSWRALGGRVWIDPTIKLLHVGEYEYTGDLTALLEAAPTRPI